MKVPCAQQRNNCRLYQFGAILIACAVLHNISIGIHDDLPNDSSSEDDNDDDVEEDRDLNTTGVV